MAGKNSDAATRASGYHEGSVDVVLSVDDVARQAEELRAEIPEERLMSLARDEPFLSIRNLRAGYGNIEILHPASGPLRATPRGRLDGYRRGVTPGFAPARRGCARPSRAVPRVAPASRRTPS